jgi:hypothetical protein
MQNWDQKKTELLKWVEINEDFSPALGSILSLQMHV